MLALRDGVERGEGLYRTAQTAELFTPLALQMIAIGEETGALGEMLDEVADFYEREVDYDLENLSAAIEPMLIVAVGAMVHGARARRVPAAVGHRGRRRRPRLSHAARAPFPRVLAARARGRRGRRRRSSRAWRSIGCCRSWAARSAPRSSTCRASCKARCCSRRPSASRAARSATLPELAAANPMALLLKPPANYVGELGAPATQPSVPPRDLVLRRAGRPARLSRRPLHALRARRTGPQDRIELRVAFVFEDRDGDGVFDAAGDRVRRSAARARARLRLAGLSAPQLT